MGYAQYSQNATNINWRGNRIYLMLILSLAVCFNVSNMVTLRVALTLYMRGATERRAGTMDRGVARGDCMGYRWEPYTCLAGVAYDFVWKPGTSCDRGYIYECGDLSPPQAVLDCLYPGISYVSGATPGSFTEVTTSMAGVVAMTDNFAAGSSTGVGQGIQSTDSGVIA